MSSFEIQLRDVMIQSNHGVLPEERVCGNQYRVNVRIRISADAFNADEDNISNTVSYAEVYELLVEVMSHPANLLESVAVKFASEVRRKWPFVKSGDIEIVKIVPPIPGMIGEAGVKYDF